MLVYRITSLTFSHSLFASGTAGRWNRAGRKVIYAAESIPLAFMENMVRRKGLGFNADFEIMVLEIPDNLPLTTIDPVSLPTGWRSSDDYTICQSVGDAWYDTGTSLILQVPSAVLPVASNYVLHSLHPDFSKITLIKTLALLPDERIEDLLKNYRKP